MALDWKTAYASMHRSGEATFPAAGLHYVLQLCREGGPRSPAQLTSEFHDRVYRDFGPFRNDVLEDWGLRTPTDLGRAVLLLGHHGCLALEASDTLEAFSAVPLDFREEAHD